MQWKVFAVFLCAVACSYYYVFFMDRAQVSLEIEVSQETLFKMYWADEKQQFSEKKSASQRLYPSQTTYDFSLAGLGGYAWLRFDPIQYSAEAVVKNITITQQGYKTVTVSLEDLQPLNQIGDSAVTDEGLKFSATGTDPFFLYPLQLEKEPFQVTDDYLMMALICVIVIVIAVCCSSLRRNFGFVPIMLAMVLVLILTMAKISAENAHPDEYVHLAATSYYTSNWLPPAIGDQTIQDTYSVYGMSRLNNGEIYYLVAGKAAVFFENLNVDRLLSLRLFNVSLFFIIVLLTFYSVPARAAALPFLVSPQIWYVFSYCTSDALALFICFLAACELVRPASFLSRALTADSLAKRILPTLVISLLLGLLFLLKNNYYPFIALFYVCLFWRIVRSSGDGPSRAALLVRIIVFTVLAIGLAGIRVGMDYYVNGADRSEKIQAMQEKTAKEMYKPSTPLQEKHASLFKKARGIPLKSLIVKNKWFIKTFNTGFGHYGYFTVGASPLYYELARWFAAIVLIYILGTVFVRGSTGDSMIAIAAVLLSVALIGASLYHSWTMDFQAQGRYLFPILSMFGVLLGRCRNYFDTRLLVLSMSQLYFLGLYSFIFVAIMNIPRP